MGSNSSRYETMGVSKTAKIVETLVRDYVISRLHFDELVVVYKDDELFCAYKEGEWPSRRVGYRVPQSQAGLKHDNGAMLNMLGIKHLKTMPRWDLQNYVYDEIAKIALARMDKMLLGKND